MNKKANGALVLILIAIAVGIGIFIFLNSSSQSMITINYYDSAGNKISPIFSVVGGTPGVAQIDLGINVRNTGSTPLTCNLGTISPTAFNSAVTKSTKTIQPSTTGSWASGLISVAQFESMNQPVTFSAQVTCSYTAGTTITLPVQTGSLSLTITPDATGSFTVDVASNAGGTPTVCGNSVCESGETSSTCPADCVSSSNVKFRTLNKAVDFGGASDMIGVSETCGATLTKAGQSSNSKIGTAGQTCDNLMAADGYTKLFAVPAITSINSGTLGYVSSTNPTLYKKGTNYFMICADGTVPVAISFWTGSSAASLSSSATSIDSTKEVAC